MRSLIFALLTLLCHTCIGAFISPIAYTLTDVESVNGSSANGGCPQECEGMTTGEMPIKFCNCGNGEAITGVLIDGMVPTIDTSMSGTWAAELYTVETTRTTLPIGFLFQSSVMLHEVELYVFYCPAWDIGTATISVYNGESFPNFVRIGTSAESVGSVTLTSDMQICEDLTRVSIPLQMATSTSIYFIEFTNFTPPQQLYIAEVRFSDQPIPPPTEPATISSPTTIISITTIHQTEMPTTSAVSDTQPTTPSISNSSPDTNATPITTTPTQPPTVPPTTSPIEETPSSLPVSAAIAGGAVGGVLILSLLVVIACAVILSYRKKEKRKKNHSRKDTQLEMKMKKNDTYLNMESGPLHQQHSMATNETGEVEELEDEAGYFEIKEENHDTEAEIKEENSDTEAIYSEVKEKSAASVCFMGSNLNSAASTKSKNEEEKDKNKEEVEKQVLEYIYSVVSKTKKDKALKGSAESGNNIPIPQEELEQLVYAPIYDVPALDMESLKLPKLTPENIKKVKTLGSGQFGKVILADTVDLSPKDLGLSDTDDNKSKSTHVAVKTLKKNPTASMKEAFEKELKFMSCLKHPNIIRTLGACMTVNTPFVVMEYMEKGDLNQYLLEFDSITYGNSPPKNLTISTGTLTNMSAQIANAMAYLVHRNFIHRDLATRNCLVGPDLEIKIADFGMSRNLYKSQYCLIRGHVVLPVRWMARECFSGRFSSKSDVWSFGVTMWEIFTLTKDIPYEDMDDQEVICDATKNGQSRKLLERPKDCPQKVYNIMLMCWAEDPHERATFEELYEVLSSVSFDADTMQ